MTKITPKYVQGWATSHLIAAAGITFAAGLLIGALLF